MTEVSTLDRFRGCLLGGAVGDALGAPIEFHYLEAIRRRYGSTIDLLALPEQAFTDDTQMTLFTAEGLIRTSTRGRTKGVTSVVDVTHHAYLRWLHTQGTPWRDALQGRYTDTVEPDGWLVTNRVLHRRAAPGNTCLSALHSGRVGTMDQPLNDSKGCGGVMRVAPVGLFVEDAAEAFRVGCELAAITHSHPSGYYSAGALAAMIARLVAGDAMAEAVAAGRRLLDAHPDADETAAALDAGIALAEKGVPEPELLEELGGGWVGEEALAMSVACALAAGDVAEALSVAVLHSGDSDSTGAICGNLLGAERGIDALPPEWVQAVEGWQVVDAVARDLWRERYVPPAADDGGVTAEWLERYPGS